MIIIILLTYFSYIIYSHVLPNNIIILPRYNVIKLRGNNISILNFHNRYPYYKLQRVETDNMIKYDKI